MSFESFENNENNTEEILSERAGLLGGIAERVKNLYVGLGEKIETMSPESQERWARIKEAPLFRGLLLTTEGVLGSEPGKPLNTKEALVKCAAGVFLTGVDFLKKREGKTAEDPFFEGKTFETIDFLKNKALENQESGVMGTALDALFSLLKKNEGLVSNLEENLDGLARKTY